MIGALRTAALIALPVGAAGSVALLLLGGRRNPSVLVMVLFSVWVASPYALLGLANAMSARWSEQARLALYGLILAVTVVTLPAYANAVFGPPRAQQAFFFVALPPVSWIMTALVLPFAQYLSKRRS